jgi:CDGSH-type Zn-finger protein
MSSKITVNKNGSLKIEGEFDLFDHNGNKFELSGRTVISLCRCGQSEKQPFCDGAHKRCGFESEVVATILPPPASAK